MPDWIDSLDPLRPHAFIRRVVKTFGELSDRGGWWHTLSCKHVMWSVDRKPKSAEVHCGQCKQETWRAEDEKRRQEHDEYLKGLK